MLTLILLRHAKAEGHSGEDFARRLTERGKADAAGVGRHMGGLRIRPDLALVSAAERTRQTYDIYAAAGLPAAEVRYEKALYNASESALRDILRYVDPRIGTLMVVGHNPGIMDVAVHLARHGDAVEITRLRGRFPPGSLALVAFDSDDWRDARASGGRLDLLLLPEDIASPS